MSNNSESHPKWVFTSRAEMLEAITIFWANVEGFTNLNIDGNQVNTDGANENGFQYSKEGVSLFVDGKIVTHVKYINLPSKGLEDTLLLFAGIFKI